MNLLTALLDLLPPPYTTAPDSVIAQVLNVFALEMEALQEDVEAMRQSHWVEFAPHRADLEKLAALVDVRRFPWEDARLFRARLSAFVTARLRGTLGKEDIKRFVADYLRQTEEALCELRGKEKRRTIFVPGLAQCKDPFETEQNKKRMPHFRALEFVENPRRLRRSAALASVGGRVPHLHRWEESNRGLEESAAEFRLTGFSGRRTSAPVIANLTTGDLVGYKGTVPAGRTLRVSAAGGDDPRLARADIDGDDVTGALFSVGGFQLGVPFAAADEDERPLLPRVARGANSWIYLSVGFYDVRGLDHFTFAVADEQLRPGLFNQSSFDHAIFPTAPAARLEVRWEEVEPASFEVRVPWYLIVEQDGQRPHEIVAEGLEIAVGQLHAAGVRAEVRFVPFVERQPQRDRLRLPWVMLDPERSTAGRRDKLSLGAHFGETGFGDSRFE
jgi:hypothetical protein